MAITFLFPDCNKRDRKTPLEGIELAKKLCGNDMSWLSDIIAKAEEDKTSRRYQGNYIGTVYLTSFQNRPVILINMPMGSGGLVYYAFDCNHQRLYPTENGQSDTFYTETVAKGKIIYSNGP